MVPDQRAARQLALRCVSNLALSSALSSRATLRPGGNLTARAPFMPDDTPRTLIGRGVIVAGDLRRHAESGLAAFYGGGRTASGEVTSPTGLTAAHRTLPFGTMVLVTNVRNGKTSWCVLSIAARMAVAASST